MYVYDSHPDIKRTKNLYEDQKIDSNKNSFNSYKYNSVYNNKEKTYHQSYLNHNYSFNNIQKKNHNFIYNRQLNNKTPHRHHHYLIHFHHHHCHTPLSHSHSTSHSCSCSCSPSPIKNISQPIINTNYKNEFNNSNKVSNQSMSNYNYNNNKSSKSKFFNFDNITKGNEYINNIYNKQIRAHEIDKNNSILYSNSFINNDNEASFSNAKAFDEYMTKVAINKYNKMKRFNESNYSHKQIEDLDYNNNSNYNNESFINEYNLIKKNLEEKYKLYNLISNYDDTNANSKNINSNKFNSNINKNISNENYNEITKDKTNENIKEDLIIDKSFENEQIKEGKHEKNININKDKNQKIDLNNGNKNNKNKKHNYHQDKHAYHNNSNNNEKEITNSSELIETGFSPEIKRNENFSIIKDKYNKIDNVIQKTINERIGSDSITNNISSSYDDKKNIHKEDNHNDKDIDNNQNKNKENKYENNLFDYITKENEELKKLNNSYKQLLDILFYFLNNISQKNQKKNDNSNNEINPSKLFDLSKDLNDPKGFSKKLINLEFLVNNNNKDKYNNKENGNDNKKDNENDKDNLKIDNNVSLYINNENKINSLLLLKITKENSIQLPELSKLVQFNNLIEGMNEKCFSFKDEELIENFPHNKNKKDVKNNNINKNYIKIDNNNNNMMYLDNEKKHLDKQIIDKINNESDRCFACLLGCNVSKRGYSPMRYNPYTKNELRIDDSGYLLDRYNELKASFDNENIGKFNIEKNIYHKIPKINNNSKYNSMNNSSRDNNKFVKKKIWK